MEPGTKLLKNHDFFNVSHKLFKSFYKNTASFDITLVCNDNKIIKLEKEINEKENLIRNVFAKFEELNERIDALEKRVKMAEEEKDEHPDSNFTISCNVCDLVFKSESELDNHTEEKHGNNVVEKEKASSVISENNETNLPKADKNVFQCDECNYISSSENGIKIHKSKKHVYRCRYCNMISPDLGQHEHHVSECSAAHIYNSPIMSPRGHFPPRFPPRFPHSPMW